MAKRKHRIQVTDPCYFCGENMLYHAGSKLGFAGVFREEFGAARYRVVVNTEASSGSTTHTLHHTLAWAKRMVRKGLGGSW